MQVMLILGILSAIGAVFFALQNTASVVVNLALWQFEGSLAVALLVALGLGVLITGLLSSPSVIRRQWENARLRRQVESLERELAGEKQRNGEYVAAIERLERLAPETARPVEEKPYVGLRTLLAGEDEVKPPRP